MAIFYSKQLVDQRVHFSPSPSAEIHLPWITARHWFPGLLHCEGFLREFVTPIVKCSRGSEVVSFFTLPVAWPCVASWGVMSRAMSSRTTAVVRG